MLAVDPMSRWRRRLTGGMLAAFAVTLLNPNAAHAEPSATAPSSQAQASAAPGSTSTIEADLRFELKVRLIGEFPELSDARIPESDRETLLNTRLEERWLSTR